MSKPISLERRAVPEKTSSFFLKFYGLDWKRHRRYETVERAIQAHESMARSFWNTNFEWRLNTPVGVITLPVVKV